jgi:hypothetical protein
MAASGAIPFQDESFRRFLLPISRFCENECNIDDLCTLIESYHPVTHKKRHIYPPQMLKWKTKDFTSTIFDIKRYEEVIFSHQLDTGEWLIFLFFTNPPRNETIVIGNIDDETIESLSLTLTSNMKKFFPKQHITGTIHAKFNHFQLRNKTATAFVFIHYLYQHWNYFHIDADSITRYKLKVLSATNEFYNFIRRHDLWLGMMIPTGTAKPWCANTQRPIDNPWHPFVVTVSDGRIEFEGDLDDHGWVVIDVDGDGNCGFYCLILGLENNNNFSFSPKSKLPCSQPMSKNKPWQYCVMQLRHRLANESKVLTSTEYNSKAMELGWFMCTSAENEEDFQTLGDWFLAEDLDTSDYFNGSLRHSDWDGYMMMPYWAPLVFSHSFKVRVVVYTRTSSLKDPASIKEKIAKESATQDHFKRPGTKSNGTSCVLSNATDNERPDSDRKPAAKDLDDIPVAKHSGDSKEQDKDIFDYTWATHIMDHTAPIQQRITDFEGIYKLSDEEFQRKPTIEIVFTTPLINSEFVNQDKHFQFLRRGFLHGVKLPPSHTDRDGELFTSTDTRGSGDMERVEQTDPECTDLPIESQQRLELTDPENTHPPTEPVDASHLRRETDAHGESHQVESEDDPDSSQSDSDSVPSDGDAHGESHQGESEDDPASSQSDSDSVSSDGDPRPQRARRPVDQSLSQAEKQRVKENIQMYFNQRLRAEPKESIEALYDPTKKIFKTRMIYRNGRRSEAVESTDIAVDLRLSAMEFPREWIGPTTSTTPCPPRQRVTDKPKFTADGKTHVKPLTKSLVDTRPTKARRGIGSACRDKARIHNFFNQLRRQNHIDSAQLKYDPIDDRFYVRSRDVAGRLGPVFLCDDIDQYDDNLIISAKEFPNRWMGPTLGDTNYEVPPSHLLTNVITVYQQLNKRYCLTHSLASALFYAGLHFAARVLASQGEVFSTKQFDDAISELRGLMQSIAPCIATPIIYGIRTKTHSRIKRTLEWDHLLNTPSKYPTIVIPVLPDGSRNHAFCLIDDLIFDSSVQNAMKLTWESVQWICRGFEPKVFCAFRFCTKFSQKGTKTQETYEHVMRYNWGDGAPIHGSKRMRK